MEEKQFKILFRKPLPLPLRLGFQTLLLLVFLPGLLSQGSVRAAQLGGASTGMKMRVAVVGVSDMGFAVQPGLMPGFAAPDMSLSPSTELANGLTEMLTTELLKTGRFIVLERAALQQVTMEQDFGASERVNRDTTAARGLLTGAQALITAKVTEFSFAPSRIGGGFTIAGFNIKAGRATARVELHIRMIDVVTGEVMISERVKGSSSATDVSSEGSGAASSFNVASQANRPFGRASRKAIERGVAALSEKLNHLAWSSRIADVRGNDIYLNAGADLGVQVGMEFEVSEPQEAVIDPDTGRVLGAPERKIGTIRIVAVEGKYSIARATAGEMIKRNQVARSNPLVAKQIFE